MYMSSFTYICIHMHGHRQMHLQVHIDQYTHMHIYIKPYTSTDIYFSIHSSTLTRRAGQVGEDLGRGKGSSSIP